MLRYKLFIHYTKKLALILAITAAIFTINRLIFMFRFGDFAHLITKIDEWPLLLFTGFRFDLMVITYIFSIPFLLTLLLLAFPYNWYIRLHLKCIRIWIIVFIPLLTTLLLADQEFYSFFQLHFDTVTFDFLNEKPLVLLRTIWEDHPVLLFISIYAALTWLTLKAPDIFMQSQQKPPKLNTGLSKPLQLQALCFSIFWACVPLWAPFLYKQKIA